MTGGATQVIPKKADVVVIGAGIVGCTRGPPPGRGAACATSWCSTRARSSNTGGSSFHAPGLVFQTSPLAPAVHARAALGGLYREPRRAGATAPGSASAASRSRRRPSAWPSCTAAATTPSLYGLAGEVVDRAAAAAARAAARPGRDPRGLPRPSDGLCKVGHRLPRAAPRAAEAAGARVPRPRRASRASTSRGGRVRGVETPEGTIATSHAARLRRHLGPRAAAPDRPPDPDAADAAPVRLDEPAARAGRRDARRRATRSCATRTATPTTASAATATASAPTRTTRCRSTCPSSSARPTATRRRRASSRPSTSRTPGTRRARSSRRARAPASRRRSTATSRSPPDGNPLLGESRTCAASSWPRRSGSRTPPAGRARWPT